MFRLHCITYVLIRWWRFHMVTLEYLEMIWRQNWWFSEKRRRGQLSQRPCDVPAAFSPSRSRCKRWETETKCGSGLTQRLTEAAVKIPHPLPRSYLSQRCTEAAGDAREMKTQEMETKCGSGLTQRCDETAGKIPRSLPRSYLSQRCDDEARKPLRVSQRLGGAVSRGRCESRKSTFSVFDQIITNLCFG